MRKWIIHKVLWLIAWLLIPILTAMNKKAVRKVYGSTKGYDLVSAANIDKFGNREFKTWLNRNLLLPTSQNHFGHPEETVSSVLGKNQRDGTLSKNGNRLRKLVDWADKSVPNHCLHWINIKINHKQEGFFKYFK